MKDPNPAAASSFIGRSRELAFLRSALEEARAGRGGLVMLVGEAGIGKTRTAEELAASAAAAEFRVLWGHCGPEEGASPYRPWIQALRALLEETETGALRTQLGTGARHLAEILPEIRARWSALPTPAEVSPESARFQLFDAVGAWLRRASRSRPILLVLEDLHWADASSLRLLAFLGRELSDGRLLLLGTRRETEPPSVPETLASVRYRTLPLAGLRREEVARIVAAVAPGSASREDVASLHARTGGHPFFVTEIARWLSAGAEHRTRGGRRRNPSSLPGSVRSLVAEEIGRLTGDTRRLLGTAAAIGEEFSPHLLARIGAEPDRTVAAALDEAAEAGILREAPSDAPTGALRFRHGILRQALYEDLSADRRREAHRRIARTLEEAYGTEAGEHAPELARHWAHAGAHAGPEGREKVAAYSAMAGTRALSAHAYDEAVEHLERALAARGERPLDARAAGLLVELGRARAACSLRWNRQDAWDDLRRALDHYLEEGDVTAAVHAAVAPSISVEGAVDVADRLQRLLELVPPESAEAGWLAARHAAALYFETGDYGRASRSFDRALANARDRDDPALELRALGWANAVDHFEGRWTRVVENGLRVIRLAGKIEDLHSETYARYRVSLALAFRGEAQEAGREARASLARAERLGDRGLLGDTLYTNAALAQLAGRWDEARALASKGLEASPRHMPLLHLEVVQTLELGESERGERLLERLLEAAAHAGPYPLRRPFRALVLAQVADLRTSPKTGRRAPATHPDLAARRITPGIAGPADPATPVAGALVTIGRALLAVRDRERRGTANAPRRDIPHGGAPHGGAPLGSGRRENDLDEARICLRQLEPLKGTITAPLLATDRLLGRLAGTVGEVEIAADRFEAALEFCRRAGYRPELAWSCYDYARFLLKRDPAARRRERDGGRRAAERSDRGRSEPARSDAERAGSLLEEASALSAELRMAPLSARCAALADRFRGRLPPEPAELTPREIEVLRLVATGRTNRQIAGALSISPHTVAVHVSRILAKTGSGNRTEAARWARDNQFL